MVKKFFFLALFIAAFNFMENFAHKKTDGFSVRRIQFSQPLSKETPIHLPELNQLFHYLDCGNQCYAFISEDKKYVLKFFKYAHPPVPRSLTKIPVLNHFKAFRPHRYEKMLWKQQRDFKGYELAFASFRSEAGLIAVHLLPEDHSFPTITITDKLGCRLTLDLNRTPFILQHMTTPVYEQLRTWIAAGRLDLAKEGLASIQTLLRKRIELNLKDDDVHFYSNFGFVGTAAIQVDPGHFTQGATADTDLEMKKITKELVKWCNKNAPELL